MSPGSYKHTGSFGGYMVALYKYSMSIPYYSATNFSALDNFLNLLMKASQLGSLSYLKWGVMRYNKWRSVSKTSYPLASAKSLKIFKECSGGIELAKAAFPS